GISHVELRFAQRLTAVERFQLSQLGCVLIDFVGELEQKLRSVEGGQTRPGTLIKGFASSLDCLFDLLRTRFCYFAQRLAIRRVVQLPLRSTIFKLAVDPELPLTVHRYFGCR